MQSSFRGRTTRKREVGQKKLRKRERGGGGCNQRPTEGREGMRLSKGIKIREVGERNLWVLRESK